jgi:two-component system, NarL family, sensor kinase
MTSSIYKLLLALVLLVCRHLAISDELQPWQSSLSIEIMNDSAARCIEAGQVNKARHWIDQALKTSGTAPSAQLARTFFLLGDLEENEGFTSGALVAYRRSVILAHKSTAQLWWASSLTGMASALTTLGHYDSASLLLEESVKHDTSQRQQVLWHLAYARFWQNQNLNDKSLLHWQQAYDKAAAIGDKKLMALSLTGMASILFNQNTDMNVVLDHIKRAIALCDSSRHANIIARNYGRMANVYMTRGATADAARCLERAKKITDISGNLPVAGYVMSSMAILKAEQGDIQAAAQLSEEPIRIKRRLGQWRALQNDLLNLTEWYTVLGNYPRARETLQEGLATSKRLGDVMFQYYFYERFAILDSLTGNYRAAYANLKRSAVYKDSAQSLKRFQAIEAVREQYEAGQREKTIAEKEVVIQRQKYQQALMAGVAVIAVLVFIVVLVVLQYRNRTRLQRTEQQQYHLRLQTIVHTQEEVQQSIARDIHDGLVQVLGAAKLSLQAVNVDQDKTVVLGRIQEASRIMDEACAEARNISHQILPYSLMKDGLAPALKELLEKSLRDYECSLPGNLGRLNESMEVNLYRIAQELVNNIVKHAEASYVEVTLTLAGNVLTLSFRDNGRGFDMKNRRDGVGLTNIITRANLIGGTVSIESEPGKGTYVQLTVNLL